MVAIAIGLFAGVGKISTNRNKPDTSKVNSLTQKMITSCVGRFTIDLPEGAEVEFTPARVAGVSINVKSGYTEEKLKSDVSELEQVLAPKENEYDRPSLEKKIVMDAVNFKSTLVYYGREKPVPPVRLWNMDNESVARKKASVSTPLVSKIRSHTISQGKV
jgi:hypothetical protein